jgi:sulfonate transport system substrate-binding protein
VRLLITLLLTLVGVRAAEPLRVTVTRMPVSAPVYLAREQGLFKKAGLEVELREYELGKIALEDLSAGKVDVAFAAVTPLVYKALAGEEFRILATVASSTGIVALAGRTDLGVEKIGDIRGKRIGLVKGTSGEFFFDTMRVLNRIPRDGLHVVDSSPDELAKGLRNGTFDLVSVWEPDLQELRSSLTNRLTLFFGDGLYTFSWNMVVLPATVSKRRQDLEKFVNVLFEAAESIEADPEAAANLLIERLGPLGRDMTIDLKETRFRPQVGQELLVAMEGEARWIINRDQRTNAAPNFLRWLDTSILKQAHPAAVTVIQ